MPAFLNTLLNHGTLLGFQGRDDEVEFGAELGVREPWLTPALAGGTQEAERGASGSRRAPWFGYLASCLSLGMGEVSGLGGTRAP